jgi:hypothetical protein
MTPAGFPHSDIPGSTLGCQLPRAYRRLLRPSSALDAKASTMCPSQLVTTNTTSHNTKTRTCMHNHTHTLHTKNARVHYTVLKLRPHKKNQPPPTSQPHNAEGTVRVGVPDLSGPNSVPHTHHTKPTPTTFHTPTTQQAAGMGSTSHWRRPTRASSSMIPLDSHQPPSQQPDPPDWRIRDVRRIRCMAP